MLLDMNHETPTREKIPNMMHKELGLPLMYLMHDYLVWEEGLRIRDRLSHGISITKKFIIKIKEFATQSNFLVNWQTKSSVLQ